VRSSRHYRRPLTVAVLARALASSPRQLQRAFEEVGKTSFTDYLREVRLRNAAQLLASQLLTVRQVSLLVGYRQPAHFAKAFRAATGSRPRRTASAPSAVDTPPVQKQAIDEGGAEGAAGVHLVGDGRDPRFARARAAVIG
jgi:AraC-like DNA-binding protein